MQNTELAELGGVAREAGQVEVQNTELAELGDKGMRRPWAPASGSETLEMKNGMKKPKKV